MTSRRRYGATEREAAARLVRETGRTARDVGRELGINARTLARWVRADLTERRGRRWADQVRPHFDFLAGYGFGLTDISAEPWWKVAVTYRSAVGAVEVAMSNEYGRVELSLMRLVDGDVPPYPVFIVDAVPVDWFLADWLLELRADPGRRPGGGLSDAETEAQLAFWAAALRDLGGDFLEGDLSVLDELERMIRDHARRHGPPVVTIWAPQDARPEETDRTADMVRATTPDGVSVRIRHYRSPRAT